MAGSLKTAANELAKNKLTSSGRIRGQMCSG